jgi:hypothetical protein
MFPDGSSIPTVIVQRVTKLTPYFMLHLFSRAPRLLVANIMFLVLLAAMHPLVLQHTGHSCGLSLKISLYRLCGHRYTHRSNNID